MSLKVIHTKPDGSKVPIKVSIWEAFRGVPDPKPAKPKPCSCCGKFHCKTKDTNAGHKGDAKTTVKNQAKKEDDNGLTDDDRIILRMKGVDASASWAEILAATSGFKHVGEIKNRFKEIKHYLDDDNKKDSKAGKAKEKNTDREELARMRREEGLKKAAEKRAAREAGEKARKEEAEKEDAKAKEDEEKKTTKSGKGNLKKWAEEYDKNKGVVLAARHFDETGIRISAKEALAMLDK